MPVVMTEVDRLYAIADDHEADTLDQLRERAGITWECRVDDHWTNMKGERCERCGRTERRSKYVESLRD